MSWIEKYGHGGDFLTAAENFNIPIEQLIDFSANINPLGPPKRVVDLLHSKIGLITHYPDPHQRLFREKLSDHLEIPSESVWAGNGAAECIALAMLALKPSSVGVIYPCFSEYEKLAQAYDIPTNACYGLPEDRYKAKLADIFELMKQNQMLVIGNPNNPTGTGYSADELRQIARWSEQLETYVVVDEAFIDFIPPQNRQTLLHDLHYFKNVIIIRSMTKFYALAGLRLGYVIAHPDIIEKIRIKQVTWSVNQLALLAGITCLDEEEYEKETIEYVSNERNFLKQCLEKLDLDVFPAEANFLFIKLPETITASELQLELGKRGIMIRSCAMYPGLTEYYIRIAVRKRDENELLISELKQIFKGNLTPGLKELKK
jgi:threonine-phosphate decarboxylase